MAMTEKSAEDSASDEIEQPKEADSQQVNEDDSEEDPQEGLRKELQDYKDRFIRAHAEMENMRRRMDKERSDLLKYGMEGFFRDLLPILDSFSQVDLDSQDESKFGQFAEGVGLVKKQLQGIVEKHGLEAIKSSGEVFDPNLHQAIQKIDSEDVDCERISEEFAKGYLLNGRLIRPSMVSVKVPSSSGE